MNPPPPQPPLPTVAVDFPPSHTSSSRPPPPPPKPTPPPPLFSAALSNLTSLLHLSTTALRSLPAPICIAAASSPFLLCPYNPNHRLPPSSLFSHYLNCPSQLPLPHTFQYHTTLQSATPYSLSTTSSDLTLSLDDYIAYNSNFFYKNCPGPVTLSTPPSPLLTLPRDLYIECGDFIVDPPAKEAASHPVDFIRFLPSEISAIQSETEAWGAGFPAVYSSRILRAVLRLRDCNLYRLNDWIVSNSPRHGVIIDFSMSDHVVLLVRLCLKAVVREAFMSGGFMFGNRTMATQSFECSVLVKVMAWLALQFSVLYGSVNGKIFADDVLKKCILDSASLASLFPLEQNDTKFSDFEKDDCEGQELVQSISTIDDTQPDEEENVKGKTVGNCMIFLPQVAAAVAALHERSLIEEKIKSLRKSRPISAYERNMEHAYLSKMAAEERAKRPEYRPIVEHDGFLRQRSNNEANKEKTPEELLAEERDYKRRRMSYRGKKSKRNTLEVTRDIIEEYMEEIKKARGTGDVSENVEKTEVFGTENRNTHASSTNVSKSKKYPVIPNENREGSLDSRKEFHTSSHDDYDFKNDIQQTKQDPSWDRGHQDHDKGVDRNRQDRGDYSRRRDGRLHDKRSEPHEHKHHKRNRDGHEEGYNHEKERDEHRRSSRRKRESYKDKREQWDERIRKKNMNHSSSRRAHHEFDDRYEPTGSHEFYEDDF
ncbi:U11/U12 small nuclear ribonucleoprotein 48 kDa protein [Striga hermonthica]|uniref:U11/U12 small nuclear ribonucleoprotein 48 kDa protein n=1 Tax=Striga hermonthica TaxID=68872 RepID=A0A9N7MUH0_STRHE|nr:U11/U12 small nuclear ribonucleoprotein 48 kDa protein [Striga hermonthica]